MSPPPHPTPHTYLHGNDGLPSFDEPWLDRIEWYDLDHFGELSRWRGRDPSSERSWLIVRASLQASLWELARLDREYAIGLRLEETWAVIPVARLSTATGPLLVLNDDNGRPLSSLAEVPCSVERFLQLAIASTRALALAHERGIVHRDIRPENLMLGKDGNIRLTGFAFATLAGDSADSALPFADSSLAYLAPELAGRQQQCASPRSDLYALGVTFYQLLTGHLPFSANDPVQWLHQHVAVAAPAAAQWRSGLPPALGELLAWLLAKQPEQRPESAHLLEVELRSCLNEWRELGSIRGAWSQASRKGRAVLVGRALELGILHDALGHLKRGMGGAVLIGGEAGIGKTSLIHQLRRSQHNDTLLFANGKCELSRHQVPYAALAGTLASLFVRLTGEAPEDVKRWGRKLRTAVGENSNMLVRIIPELEYLTGPLPADSNPPPVSEARRNLHGMLQRLLEVIASAEHPLILFLDDVQWIDEESQAFISELVPASFDHLLLIAAYRDDEVLSSANLNRLLDDCRQLGSRCVNIVLRPLAVGDIAEMLHAELDLPPHEQDLLAGRLNQKGHGNPLYVAQFVALLRDSVHAFQTGEFPPLLEDIAALMQSRLERLPQQTRDVLHALAILGNHTPLESLAAIRDISVPQLLNLLRPAFKAGLVSEYRESLSFSHDTIWESARAQITAPHQTAMRNAFASVLLTRLDEDAEPEAVFRVAAQVVRVDATRLDPAQRRAFIELLLHATRMAMASAAAATALDYLAQVNRLLTGMTPTDDELVHTVDLLHAHALILNADYTTADGQVSTLLMGTAEPLARAELYRLRCEICCLRGDYAAAVRTAIDGLALLDFLLPYAPTDAQAEQAWQELQEALAGRPPGVFATLADIQDTGVQAVIELLSALVIPGSLIQPNLMLMTTCQIATLTLQHGISAAAVHAIAWLGVSSAHRFDTYSRGFDYAATAHKLVEQPRFLSIKVSALLAMDQVSVWTRPLPFSLECAESAYRESIAQGSPSLACYANNHIVSNLLVLGAPIERMLRQIDAGLAQARNLEFVDAQSILYVQARYIRHLAGAAASTIPIPDSMELAQRVRHSSMGPLHFWWELFEGLLAFLAGAYEQAAVHLDAAWALTWSAPTHIHLIDLAMFSVLNRAALQTTTGQAQDIAQPMQRLRLWAELNPRYFADRLALAEAELLRLQGQSLAALKRYEDAINKARGYGAIHLQGLAHTLASLCHEELGLQSSQRIHVRKAWEAWRRWGAIALAEQLEAQHSFLRESPTAPAEDGALPASQQLDMLSITRACQALSREIEPDSLVQTLLTNAVTHAGATYAVLMLEDADGLHVEATCHTHNGGIDIRRTSAPPTGDNVPLSLILQVRREHQALVTNVYESLLRFGEDPYLTRLESGSIICLPLLKQNEVIGVLYLENTLTPDAFEESQVSVLQLLAAQAAISLNTARLYANLLAENQRRRESESTLRRTQALLAIGQEVSHYGTFVWRPQSERSFWSPRLIAELGLRLPANNDYQADPTMLVHADDRQRVARCLEDACAGLAAFRLEFRTVSLDGMARYLELAGAPDGADAFIGVVCDITERRQTETALRAARSELDRTSQATILGELTASIAHEINQPLASILSNAGASIRWLERPQPEVADAIEGIRDILSEGQRAADIVSAIRALARQTPPARKPIALERVIHQVLAITRADLEDKHVSVSLKLAPTPLIEGDSIQLQQVLRNLIINALEAMRTLPPKSRRLLIETHSLGQEVLVLVEDSGPGVAPEQLGKIFQAFYSTKASGMGMGLAICCSIISAHGGSIGATQGRKDKSLFFFTLPAHHPT